MSLFRLFEYPDKFADLDERIVAAGGELSEKLEAELDALEASWEDKLHAYGALIRNSKAFAKMCREEARKLSDKAQAADKNADRAKERIRSALDAKGDKEAKAGPFRFKVVKNHKPAISIRPGKSYEDLDPKFVRSVPTLDKEALLALWKENPEAVPEAILVQSGSYLRID